MHVRTTGPAFSDRFATAAEVSELLVVLLLPQGDAEVVVGPAVAPAWYELRLPGSTRRQLSHSPQRACAGDEWTGMTGGGPQR